MIASRGNSLCRLHTCGVDDTTDTLVTIRHGQLSCSIRNNINSKLFTLEKHHVHPRGNHVDPEFFSLHWIGHFFDDVSTVHDPRSSGRVLHEVDILGYTVPHLRVKIETHL